MTQYETIKKVRNAISVNGRATAKQIGAVTRLHGTKVATAISVMGDVYVSAWTQDGRRVYSLASIPEDAPKSKKTVFCE